VYNSSVPAGFKNTIDWLSRLEGKVFQNKPVLLMCATPGKRGGRSVLEHLSQAMPFWGARLCATFGLPEFHEHFQDGKLAGPWSARLEQSIQLFEGAC